MNKQYVVEGHIESLKLTQKIILWDNFFPSSGQVTTCLQQIIRNNEYQK